MTHVEVLKLLRGNFEPQSDCAAALTTAIAALEAVKHLTANAYDHHTPHMICIPTDQWKSAMKLLPAAAIEESTNDN